MAFAEQGRYQEAVDEFSEAIHLDPGLALSYVNRGAAYNDLGQHHGPSKTTTKPSASNP